MLCETSRSGHLHYFHVLPELVQARAKMLDEDRAVALISPRIIICKTRVAGGLHAVTTRSRLVHCLPVRVKVERRYHWLARAPRKNTITEAWPRRPNTAASGTALCTLNGSTQCLPGPARCIALPLTLQGANSLQVGVADMLTSVWEHPNSVCWSRNGVV